jgi:hypothetical protein
MSEPLLLSPGDFFCSYSPTWVGALIRIGSRSLGEERTKVNHTGVVAAAGTLDSAVIVEALSKVMAHTVAEAYKGSKTRVAFFRFTNLTAEQKEAWSRKAFDYVGRRYGILKIVTHAMDYALNGAYVFRRLTHSDRYPICSWVTAYVAAAVGKSFGKDPGAVQPDDIWDYALANPEEIQLLRPLITIP